MSRSIKGSKSPGCEYYSRRSTGKFACRLTKPCSKNKRKKNRLERREANIICSQIKRIIS